MNLAAVQRFIENAKRQSTDRTAGPAALQVVAIDQGHGLPAADEVALIHCQLRKVPPAITAALARRGCVVEVCGGPNLNNHPAVIADGGVEYDGACNGIAIGHRRIIVAAGLHYADAWRVVLHEVAHCADALLGRISHGPEWAWCWQTCGCPDKSAAEFFANACARHWAGISPGGTFIEGLPQMIPP